MFAVVEILGQQFKVEKDQKLFVNKIDQKEGSKIFFDNVLLVDDGKNFSLGTPIIKDYSVEAKITKHFRGEKVVVFKKKRRKGFKVKNGHKQHLSEIIIESITKKNKKVKPQKDQKDPSSTSGSEKLAPTNKKDIDNLNSKTLAELKNIAKNKKITGYSSMKKNDLIKSINSLN